MYCDTWSAQADIAFEASLSPSSVSGLLKGIPYSKRHEFYERWAAYRQEQEYLALDIT
ncbi:MAG: hypothetical protein LBS84_01295 [Clostridiales bacterium]|nr:hypothetical protein [Clostridiales bacterium]